MVEISLVSANQEMVLHGAGRAAPVSGARRVQIASEGGALPGAQRVALDIFLEGLPDGLRAWQDALAGLLRGAGEGLALRVRSHAGAEVLETRALAGESRLLGAGSLDRARGSAALRLELLCTQGWQGAARELPLSNRAGSAVSGGLALVNHCDTDSLHDNFADIAAADLAGDLPGALRLEIGNSGAGALGDVWACLNAWGSPAAFAHVLEGEAAAGGSQVNQAGCSGGALRRVSAGSSEGTLLAWTLDQAMLAGCAGRVVRPLLRLASAPAYSDVWLWWQLALGSAVLWESSRELLSSGAVIQELPALRLPPERMPAPHPLELRLRGVGASGGYSLDVDFVQLCPLDGWRRYRAGAALAAGWTLVDDGFEAQVLACGAAGSAPTVTAQGAALRLPPAQDARLYLLHAGAVDFPLMLRAFYRPCWREP